MSRRYHPRKRSHASSAGHYLWLVGLLLLVLLLVKFGDRLPLPEGMKDEAAKVATRIAPGAFPPTAEQAAAEADFKCRVARVTDGDSLRCQDGTRVRLHAVAARETDETCSQGHPCPQASGAAATATLKRLAANQVLDCMTTGNSYDRVTAICWTPGKVEINCAMIESGTAALWERFDRQTAICRHKRRGLG